MRSGTCGSESNSTSASGATCGSSASRAVTTAGSGSSSAGGNRLALGGAFRRLDGDRSPRRAQELQRRARGAFGRLGDQFVADRGIVRADRGEHLHRRVAHAPERIGERGLERRELAAPPHRGERVDRSAPHPPQAVGLDEAAHRDPPRRGVAQLRECTQDRFAHERRVIAERVDEPVLARASSPSRRAAAARTSASTSVNSTRRSAHARPSTSPPAAASRIARRRSRRACGDQPARSLVPRALREPARRALRRPRRERRRALDRRAARSAGRGSARSRTSARTACRRTRRCAGAVGKQPLHRQGRPVSASWPLTLTSGVRTVVASSKRPAASRASAVRRRRSTSSGRDCNATNIDWMSSFTPVATTMTIESPHVDTPEPQTISPQPWPRCVPASSPTGRRAPPASPSCCGERSAIAR